MIIDSPRMLMYMVRLVTQPYDVSVHLPDADIEVLVGYDMIAIDEDGNIIPTTKANMWVDFLVHVPLPEAQLTYGIDLNEMDLSTLE